MEQDLSLVSTVLMDGVNKGNKCSGIVTLISLLTG